jgi:hypothetical protein
MKKEPEEWLFQPPWLVLLLNKPLGLIKLRAYLVVTPQCRLRLRIRRLGKSEAPKDERK